MYLIFKLEICIITVIVRQHVYCWKYHPKLMSGSTFCWSTKQTCIKIHMCSYWVVYWLLNRSLIVEHCSGSNGELPGFVYIDIYIYAPNPPPPPAPEMTCGFQLVCCKKKTMRFIGVEIEQETSAPHPKKILDPPLAYWDLWTSSFLKQCWTL